MPPAKADEPGARGHQTTAARCLRELRRDSGGSALIAGASSSLLLISGENRVRFLAKGASDSSCSNAKKVSGSGQDPDLAAFIDSTDAHH